MSSRGRNPLQLTRYSNLGLPRPRFIHRLSSISRTSYSISSSSSTGSGGGGKIPLTLFPFQELSLSVLHPPPGFRLEFRWTHQTPMEVQWTHRNSGGGPLESTGLYWNSGTCPVGVRYLSGTCLVLVWLVSILDYNVHVHCT